MTLAVSISPGLQPPGLQIILPGATVPPQDPVVGLSVTWAYIAGTFSCPNAIRGVMQARGGLR